MRLERWSPAVVAFALSAGCGGPSAVAPGVQPSHGGTLLELPDQGGFVEIAVAPSDPKARGKDAKGKVVAYFVNRDGSASLAPAPADVSFSDERGKTYPLAPKAGGPSAATEFESGSTPFAVGVEPTGKLDAKLGGKAVSLPVRPR